MKHIAVYPTSSHPPTWGHADILRRASVHFDHLFWAAAINSEKKYILSKEERIWMMQEYVTHYNLKNVTVEAYTGSTIRYAQNKNARILVKGLRNTSDFYGEYQQTWGNKGIDSGVETFCLFGKPEWAFVSSTLVRELAFLGESIDAYVLPSIAKKMYDIVADVKKEKSL